jgi:hypothetical protein
MLVSSHSGLKTPVAAPDRREQLTQLLRSLAGRLDEIDRRLADLAWVHQHRQGRTPGGENLCERTALESERQRLNDRLGALAVQLSSIDTRRPAHHRDSMRVGTCPYCGYPSLDSGLCAYCSPHLTR